MSAVRTFEPHRWLAGTLLVAYATVVALMRGPAQWAIAAIPPLVPALLWLVRSANAWLGLFFVVALLAPPLPVALGDSGPHPALVFAAVGLAIGFLRFGEWRFRRNLLAGSLVLFFAVLAISIAPAAIYSGEQIALRSLARVGLIGIPVYVFFYVSAGPGRRGHGISARLLYWVALASAAFACLDFYFQFPAPAGFETQFVWLDTGIYRRAQGVFYEASTLGNFCAFFLVMTAVALSRRAGNRIVLMAGAAVFAVALIFSYSRASVLNVVVALAAFAVLERSRLTVRRLAVLIAATLAAGAVIVYQVFPAYSQLYWARLSNSVTEFFASTGGVLAGRLESWRTLGQFLIEHPWHALLGVGYKTLPYSDFIGRPVVADNMYLSLLVETGVVGLGALLVLSAAILREAYAASRSPDSEKSFYGTWILCFWIGQMFQMFSSDLLTFWRVLPAYLWVLAMAVRR